MRELHGIYDALLTDGNASALQYTASEGLPELRALVAARRNLRTKCGYSVRSTATLRAGAQ